jgi:hypothetical protein
MKVDLTFDQFITLCDNDRNFLLSALGEFFFSSQAVEELNIFERKAKELVLFQKSGAPEHRNNRIQAIIALRRWSEGNSLIGASLGYEFNKVGVLFLYHAKELIEKFWFESEKTS